MIYKSKDGDIDLDKITRLYPAGVVDAHGDIAEMSLEWCDMSGDKVKIIEYVLVFDFTLANVEVKDRKVLHFSSKDELIETMTEVAQFFQD